MSSRVLVKRKKVVVKKRVLGKSKPKSVSSVNVKEVFSVVESESDVVKVQPNSVLVFVNGKEVGQVDTSGFRLGDFVVSQAQEYGIRTFSVYADGRKLDTSDSTRGMSNFSKIEIVAKDARG